METDPEKRSISNFLAHLSPAQGELLWWIECPSSVVRCWRRRRRRQQLVYTLGATILDQSSSILVSVFILIMAWTLLKMGVVGSKSRSLGQIFENSCLHSRGHIFSPIFLKLDQSDWPDSGLDPIEYGCGRVKK